MLPDFRLKLDTLRAVPQSAQHGLSCPLSEVKQPRIARNEPFGFRPRQLWVLGLGISGADNSQTLNKAAPTERWAAANDASLYDAADHSGYRRECHQAPLGNW